MANYQETTVSGTSYTRARSIHFDNPKNDLPSVSISEESITTLGDKTIIEPITIPQYEFAYIINKKISDFSVTFPILDLETNEPIEGLTMSYQELYAALYSMYWHLAQERDIRIAD